MKCFYRLKDIRILSRVIIMIILKNRNLENIIILLLLSVRITLRIVQYYIFLHSLSRVLVIIILFYQNCWCSDGTT
jgi:hypothetical protein